MDHPYTVPTVRGDFPDDVLNPTSWPHWKSRANTKIYKSERTLGQIWDLLEEKVQKVAHTDSPTAFQAEQRILDYIAKGDKEQDLNQQRVQARVDIESYRKQRKEASKSLSSDDFFQWHDGKCATASSRLIWSQPNIHAQYLAAAILYEQGCKLSLEGGEEFRWAMEFVWGVGMDHLCWICSMESKESNRKGYQMPLPVQNDLRKILF